MFDSLGRTVSPRKLRLFGIACCRRIWSLMTDDECRSAVLLAERLAEGEGSRVEAAQFRRELREEYLTLSERMGAKDKEAHVRLWCIGAAQNLLHDEEEYLAGTGDADLLGVWQSACYAVAHHSAKRFGGPPTKKFFDEHEAQADLLREVLGNPLRPVRFDPRWRDPAAVELARAVYQERAFDRLPVLADALKDAGCGSKEILNHCRAKGDHVRGCWVVDLVLARK
jgi:hypothetical protein